MIFSNLHFAYTAHYSGVAGAQKPLPAADVGDNTLPACTGISDDCSLDYLNSINSISSIPSMSVSKLTVEISPADWQIARLTAIAVVLALLDAAIPSPLPGIKPGLANIVTLLVFGQFGLTVAAWVSILRVLVMAVLFGYMLTPTFFLSLMGALASLLVLAGISLLMKRFSSTPLSRCFGPVTISLLCSFAHTAGQLLLVRLWLIPHAGVYRLIPLYMLAAWIFGCCNGLVVAWLNRASAQT